MSVKQDRTYARTVQDIERKYAFGKSFAETLGIANDARDKVDAVSSEIDNEFKNQATALKKDAEQIVANAMVDISNDIEEISNKVEMKVTAEEVSIAIEKEMSKGVDRVETKTGYVFDSNGLNISKSGTEMTNLLDNTGMYVKKSGDDILVANKDGVEAVDLHAKTYLIIGAGEGRSRFEDYGIGRTGCFWVGG
jgi:uncharacterized protein YbjQ (UPF0145 family)